MGDNENSNAQATDPAAREAEPDPKSAGVVLAAIGREYEHDFERFKQIEQKTAILVTFSSATLLVVAARITALAPPGPGWTWSPRDSPWLFAATVALALAALGLLLSMGLALYSLWIRVFSRLGFDKILGSQEARRPPGQVRRDLAKAYAVYAEENSAKLESKIRSWKAAALSAALAVVLLMAHSILWVKAVAATEPSGRSSTPAEGQRGLDPGGASSGPQVEDGSWRKPKCPWKINKRPGVSGARQEAGARDRKRKKREASGTPPQGRGEEEGQGPKAYARAQASAQAPQAKASAALPSKDSPHGREGEEEGGACEEEGGREEKAIGALGAGRPQHCVRH